MNGGGGALIGFAPVSREAADDVEASPRWLRRSAVSSRVKVKDAPPRDPSSVRAAPRASELLIPLTRSSASPPEPTGNSSAGVISCCVASLDPAK
ncbi:hypothetical protein MATL_G00195980 [Megalops atlanticus]|uniref:Uncharacterized protein n=1 Tax=Megalops atlanticus TaxID=7932 RepID=A0A9D3PNN2_MEGAT|nr:hypothetical protein MATL_G00195980 [Megalops atlanticus]